jgi:anaerobic magnesium-protoporphyrin IX monomethyl ester cyclase
MLTDITLIFPPLCVNEFPHLAMPLLKAYLNSKNINNVAVKDFNVDIMNQIITDGFVKVEKYFLDRGMTMPVSELEKNFNNAKQILRGDDFNKDDRAYSLINTYLRIAGSNIFEVCFCPDSLEKILTEFNLCDISKSDNKILKYINDDVMSYFDSNPTKIVGISVPFSSQIFYAFVIAREIKRRFPQTKVVLGGPQISLFGELFATLPELHACFDAMILGLGEIALEEYVNCVLQGGRLEEVHNLLYIDEDGKINKTAEKNIDDVNDLPLPDFSDLPLDKYIYGKLPYQISRGCYWARCAFCCYRDTKGYKYRNLEKVLADIQEMKNKYGIRTFQFVDDAIRPDILKNFSNMLLDRDLKIRYDAYLRLDKQFTPELCQLLKKSGLKSVLFGFESANKRLLELMNKGTNLPQIITVLRNMKDAGIQNILSCLIGFPTETKEEAMESIHFLKDYRDIYYQVFIVHFGMISDMCSHKDDFGVQSIDFKNLERYDDTGFVAIGYPYKTNMGMSPKEALQTIKEGRELLGIRIFPDNFFS